MNAVISIVLALTTSGLAAMANHDLPAYPHAQEMAMPFPMPAPNDKAGAVGLWSADAYGDVIAWYAAHLSTSFKKLDAGPEAETRGPAAFRALVAGEERRVRIYDNRFTFIAFTPAQPQERCDRSALEAKKLRQVLFPGAVKGHEQEAIVEASCTSIWAVTNAGFTQIYEWYRARAVSFTGITRDDAKHTSSATAVLQNGMQVRLNGSEGTIISLSYGAPMTIVRPR